MFNIKDFKTAVENQRQPTTDDMSCYQSALRWIKIFEGCREKSSVISLYEARAAFSIIDQAASLGSIPALVLLEGLLDCVKKRDVHQLGQWISGLWKWKFLPESSCLSSEKVLHPIAKNDFGFLLFLRCRSDVESQLKRLNDEPYYVVYYDWNDQDILLNFEEYNANDAAVNVADDLLLIFHEVKSWQKIASSILPARDVRELVLECSKKNSSFLCARRDKIIDVLRSYSRHNGFDCSSVVQEMHRFVLELGSEDTSLFESCSISLKRNRSNVFLTKRDKVITEDADYKSLVLRAQKQTMSRSLAGVMSEVIDRVEKRLKLGEGFALTELRWFSESLVYELRAKKMIG